MGIKTRRERITRAEDLCAHIRDHLKIIADLDWDDLVADRLMAELSYARFQLAELKRLLWDEVSTGGIKRGDTDWKPREKLKSNDP